MFFWLTGINRCFGIARKNERRNLLFHGTLRLSQASLTLEQLIALVGVDEVPLYVVYPGVRPSLWITGVQVEPL